MGKLPEDNVVLRCIAADHEHICGTEQVERIVDGGCPWDHSGLYLWMWWEGVTLMRSLRP